MRFVRSPVLETVVDVVFHTALVFSLFLLFAGHNFPGGGFVGGLVAGAAFVLVFLTGRDPDRPVTRVAPEVLLGVGLATAAVTGAAAWLFGGDLLESARHTFDLPVFGTVKVSSTLAFDVGVYLVVVGIVASVLQGLGYEASAAGEEATDDETAGSS